MATHSSVLAWRIPGTKEPGRRMSMGSHRIGDDWSDLAAVALIFLRTFCGFLSYIEYNLTSSIESVWSSLHFNHYDLVTLSLNFQIYWVYDMACMQYHSPFNSPMAGIILLCTSQLNIHHEETFFQSKVTPGNLILFTALRNSLIYLFNLYLILKHSAS